MAEVLQDDNVASPSSASSKAESTPIVKNGNSSRLSILIAFIAGAFAAWIIISTNTF